MIACSTMSGLPDLSGTTSVGLTRVVFGATSEDPSWPLENRCGPEPASMGLPSELSWLRLVDPTGGPGDVGTLSVSPVDWTVSFCLVISM